jgi:serine/threonine protein kinase
MQAAEQLPRAVDERLQLALERVGQIIRDRWHLDTLLGVGGTAAVYAATHRNGKRVALKILHPELSAIAEIRQRFIDEGYAANCVAHPGAVSVIDDDVTEDGHVFLIMDLLEGETLDQYVGDGGWLLPARVLTIADAVLDILAAAHEQGIVHRDVKPDNIFMTRDGAIKLLDFGIARLTTLARTHTTQTGMPLGTPGFMPPEQARGSLEQLDARTDLWALGATMFFLLTGRDVHEADTLAGELLAAMTKPAPSLGELAPHLPRPLIDLVDRALAFERIDRWADAREMQAAVRRVEHFLTPESMARPIQGEMVSPISPTLVTPTLAPATASARPRSRPPRPLVVVAASAAASFMALVAARQVGKTLRASTHTSEMAVNEVPSDRAQPSEEWRKLVVEEAAPTALPAATSSSTTTIESPPPAAKASALRPKVATRPVEGARTWVSTGARAPSELPSSTEGPHAPAAMDPLDRRK